MIERPAWLADEPEIAALLNAALDRFDRLSGDERARSFSLDPERWLPSLRRTDDAADQLWSLVRTLAAAGVLRIRSGTRSPYDPEWRGARLAFAPAAEAVLREWLARPRRPSALAEWRSAVEQHADAFATSEPLLARRIDVPGRSSQEVVAAFAAMARYAGPITLRQLSATAFWGDSKVLDDRHELIAALFPTLLIRERPIVAAVRLPEHYEGVLFIENQDTYAAAVEGEPAAARELALVYASGFRASAMRMRSRSGALLHYTGGASASARQAFERWWFEPESLDAPCWFWGDLDFAGMQILKALRQRFGASAWRPGYDPMLQMLRQGRGARRSAEAQSDPRTTGCDFADSVILPAIREHGFLDQEFRAARLTVDG